MRFLEKVLVILFLIGAICKCFHEIIGIVFLTLSSLGFLIPYFMLGFAFFNGIKARDIFKRSAYSNVGPKQIIAALFIGLALTISIWGILFKIAYWSGYKIMLLSCTVLSFFIMALSVMRYLLSGSSLYKRIMIRAIPIFTISVLLLLIK